MKNIKIRAFLIALAISLLVTGVMLYYLKIKSLENQIKTKVIVAAETIQANTIISERQLKEVMIPKSFAVPSALANKKSIVGKIAKENIYKEEQILQVKLAQGVVRDGLSVVIPPGYRAITVNIDMISGVGGKIRKGDYVDVLAFIKEPYNEQEEVKMIFQNVNVIEVGSNYITLIMSPINAEKLFLIEEVGKLRFVLKNITDNEMQNIPDINIESLKKEGRDKDE